MAHAYVIARFKFKPQHREDGHRLLQGFVRPSLEQEGCLSYELFQDTTDENEFFIVDGWSHETFLQAHAESDHVKATVAKLEPLLAEPVVL